MITPKVFDLSRESELFDYPVDEDVQEQQSGGTCKANSRQGEVIL
jgi:hypothetical protein